MPRLFLVTPRGNVELVELSRENVSLGRGADNSLFFPEDRGLSRHHLVVENEDGRWTVRDLDSKNGTFVNERRLTGPLRLQPGDRIAASLVVLTYQEPETGSHRVSFHATKALRSETASLEEILAREAGEPRGKGRPLGFFVHAGRELARHRPLPELFGVILDLCLEAVPAERGVLLTLDERGQLQMQASRGEVFQISETVRDTVLREKDSMLLENAREDERARDSDAIRTVGVQSVVAAPLQSDERVIGLIYLDSLDPHRRFTRADLDLLTALANVAGIRIELEQGELRTRQLIIENARNLSRLTAALSHELNTPLGALKSTLDSLWRTAQRGRALSEEERTRVESVQSDLRVTLDASFARMQEVIARIQRFANMDRAETRFADLNEMLEDVVALLRASGARVELELTATPLGELSCHPQPLSGAIESLVAYTMEACEEAGAKRVTLSAAGSDGAVEVRVAYAGKGMPREKLERLLEPSFEIAGARVAARTWSLFSARELVRAQGGEVRAFSDPGGETGFVVRLPLPNE
jgi:signal transduction histidine kinase